MKKVLWPFLMWILLFPSPLKAQIVYTDINPDTIIAASTTEQIKSYYLDLNNNGSYEFELRHFNPGPGMESVELQTNPNTTQEVLIHASGHAVVKTINESIASGAGTWGLDQYGILDDPWYTGGDKYLGMRFKIDGQWHYGWTRIHIATDRLSFTVKDYAFQQTPNASILVGQSVTGINEPELQPVTVYPNPFSQSTTFHLSIPAEDADLKIWNMFGQQMNIHQTSESKQILVERGDLTNGLYVYRIYSRNDRKLMATGTLLLAN